MQTRPYSLEDWKITEVSKYHKPASYSELDDSSVIRILPQPKASTKIETAEGIFTIDTQEKIYLLFPNKYNFSYWKKGEIDGIFKHFPESFILSLKFLGQAITDSLIVTWYSQNSSITIGIGKERRFLINLNNWLVKDFVPKSLEDLKVASNRLIEFNKRILPINPVSTSSTVSDLLLAANEPEFYYSEKLGYDLLYELFSQIGTFQRMETSILGTVEAENEDMIKAFLRTLAEMPSLTRNNIKEFCRTDKFFEDAHPGSVYKIKVDIPHNTWKLPPIPLGNIYPEGPFETIVCKPHILLLIKYKIPFQILESVQLRLRDISYRPFQKICYLIEGVEEVYKDQMYPINLKALHYTIVGHMLHIHAEYNLDLEGDIPWIKKFKTSKDFNPFLAFGVQSEVSCKLWERSLEAENPLAIRIDALTTGKLPNNKKEGFRLEKQGLMTFLTPYLKDTPGNTRYRDLITKDRDKPFLKIKGTYRYSVWDTLVTPEKLGVEVSRTITIVPYAYPREDIEELFNTSKHPFKLGYLLDKQFKLGVPRTDDNNIVKLTDRISPSNIISEMDWVERLQS